MNFTKGQKIALKNRVCSIIENKRNALRAKLEKEYKPSKESAKLMSKIKSLGLAYENYMSSLKALGFKKGTWYDCDAVIDGVSISVSVGNSLDANPCDIILEALKKDWIEKQLKEQTKNYVDAWKIDDEIELLTLSKDFNLDEFLAKYEAL